MTAERLERVRRSALALFAPGPPGPRWRLLRVGRVDLVAAADVVIALIVFLADNAWLQSENVDRGSPHSSGTLVVVAIAIAVPVLLRNRYPPAAWACSGAAILFAASLLNPHHDISSPYIPGAVIVYLLCVYAMGLRARRPLVFAAIALTFVGAALIDSSTTAVALPAMIPLVLAYVVRLRRATKHALAEQEARHEEETAVLEERQRIARELHDVVAHHMSVIAIQAEAAPYKVASPQPELAESLADIRASALDGLTELRRILGVLRTVEGPPTAPQPGLERLDEVIASARHGGLAIETSVTGEAPELPAGVGLSAHRILQEALSNAMKHAPGATVRIEITYDPRLLRLRVANGPGTGPPPVAGSGGGHGLVGMRERAAMLGGELDAGPAQDGGFTVAASLPLTEAEQ
jgi:signal transduction histidine kinase